MNASRTGDRNEFIELTLVSVLTAGAGLMGIDAFRVTSLACIRTTIALIVHLGFNAG